MSSIQRNPLFFTNHANHLLNRSNLYVDCIVEISSKKLLFDLLVASLYLSVAVKGALANICHGNVGIGNVLFKWLTFSCDSIILLFVLSPTRVAKKIILIIKSNFHNHKTGGSGKIIILTLKWVFLTGKVVIRHTAKNWAVGEVTLIWFHVIYLEYIFRTFWHTLLNRWVRWGNGQKWWKRFPFTGSSTRFKPCYPGLKSPQNLPENK